MDSCSDISAVFPHLSWPPDNSAPSGERRGIDLRFIQPGKPTQKAYVESVNGKFRLECLDTHWFTTLDDARQVIEAWRTDFNDVRPHSSLKDKTPSEFAAAHRAAAA